jgi:hypothetical protein
LGSGNNLQGDATIAWPLLLKGVSQRLKKNPAK